MSYENFIFSGLGFVVAKHKVTNQDIDAAIDHGFFSGLDKKRLMQSEKFIEKKTIDPELTPFNYMAEHLMGFRTRYHVVPFPPRKESYKVAENSLDLLVAAVEKALNDSGVHPEEVAAWIMGTATPHEAAPGIAETLKGFFTKISNQTQTMTTTSACVGFNINVERALSYFKAHPEANHIVVGHTEVMSSLLLEDRDFVPFTTFGDGAAAVVISRITSGKREGILDVVNYEDMAMIDFLGADKRGNLIMEPRRVKNRAVPNITNAVSELLTKVGWTNEDTDLLIPHQTGNAIVHEVGANLGFKKDKVFQEIQYDYGNLSGASVPASLALLKETGRLKPGMKIATGVAGLGGEFGGFSYIVPDFKKLKKKNNNLSGKTALVTGCTGGLGGAISRKLAEQGCRVILHYNSNHQKAEKLLNDLANQDNNHRMVKADFNNTQEIDLLIEKVKQEVTSLSYLVHTVAITGSLSKGTEVPDNEMQQVETVNYLNPARLTEGLADLISETVIFTGSIAQDAQFSGSSAYVSSKRGLHGFAAAFARNRYPKIKCIYYIPGVIDGGMTNLLNEAQIQASMLEVGQQELIPLNDIAERIVRSLYIPKVAKVRNTYEGVLVVRKDGYTRY